jgi:hypothetical protein
MKRRGRSTLIFYTEIQIEVKPLFSPHPSDAGFVRRPHHAGILSKDWHLADGGA